MKCHNSTHSYTEQSLGCLTDPVKGQMGHKHKAISRSGRLMRARRTARWREIMIGGITCAVTLVFSGAAVAPESVRTELIRLQREKGLTLAWVDKSVQAVWFEKNKIITLRDSLEAFQPDGFKFTEYPELSGIAMCWSHDQKKLASTLINRSTGSVRLGVLDLSSKQIRAIAINVDQRPYVTSQCWSPDGQRLTYEMDGAVRLYDFENNRANALAKGTAATWSPDGEWIAFRDHNTYYAIHPDGTGRKKLFHNHWGSAVSALYWSPDSRIVAYVRELGFLQGGALDAEVNELRVRRLDDGSDDRLCPDNVAWYANYKWITDPELINR